MNRKFGYIGNKTLEERQLNVKGAFVSTDQSYLELYRVKAEQFFICFKMQGTEACTTNSKNSTQKPVSFVVMSEM